MNYFQWVALGLIAWASVGEAAICPKLLLAMGLVGTEASDRSPKQLGLAEPTGASAFALSGSECALLEGMTEHCGYLQTRTDVPFFEQAYQSLSGGVPLSFICR